jgi:hydroxymethylglutaryl-CoA reductase
MNEVHYWSRLQGFFELSIKERRKILSLLPIKLEDDNFCLLDQGLSLDSANSISENVVATFSMPFSIATNFIVDGEPVLIPMVTEEPSIVAACSKMAKIVGINEGFQTKIDPSLIKGQIQIYGLPDMDKAVARFHDEKENILNEAQKFCLGMKKRGGGIVDIGIRILPSKKIGPMLLIEPVMDVKDAMGANAINTVVEGLAEKIAPLFDGTIGIKILSNLCDQRLARATCKISFKHLSSDKTFDDGYFIAKKLIAAHAFAESDVYRACTHNKGILNGIDAVALASGNDHRAIEAGAHAFASISGSYQPLTTLEIDRKKQLLLASLTLPLAVGVVGGVTSIHHGVQMAHKILGSFALSSQKLASVMVSAGLSQSLAALLALCKEGIQKGHMKLHKKKLTGRALL